jgi:hypothetical protein
MTCAVVQQASRKRQRSAATAASVEKVRTP